MAKTSILIKALLSEKSEKLSSDVRLNQYTFVVALGANKIEIKKAVEAQYGVQVLSVNTSVRPGKTRSRVIKGKATSGQKPSIKKAFVTVAPGQSIDTYAGEETPAEITETTENTANA
jgi:large subunit ribosomal protein L23